MLRLEGVRIGYGGREVVRGISLEVGRGEMVGVVGPNGAGKSTIIKGISGVLPLMGGRIYINGRDMKEMGRREVARLVGVVPQNPQIPPAFTGLEFVLLGRTPHLGLLRFEGRRDIERSMRAMELTGSSHLAMRRMGEISGGERQRILIARALSQEPQILLLDEPTAHLDINYSVEILSLIKSLSREGLAVLVAIHDLNLASLFCDRIILIKDGTLFSEGKPEDVLIPENLKKVYGVEVAVLKNPVNGSPLIFPFPKSSFIREEI